MLTFSALLQSRKFQVLLIVLVAIIVTVALVVRGIIPESAMQPTIYGIVTMGIAFIGGTAYEDGQQKTAVTTAAAQLVTAREARAEARKTQQVMMSPPPVEVDTKEGGAS